MYVYSVVHVTHINLNLTDTIRDILFLTVPQCRSVALARNILGYPKGQPNTSH